MNLILKSLLLCCVIVLVQLAFVNHIHHQSRQLALLGNLPHRYLGGLFWASQLQPQREDYVYTYEVEWLLADKEERILEGMTKPVVPMMIAKKAREFPEDRDLQKLRQVVMREQMAGKSKFHNPPTP